MNSLFPSPFEFSYLCFACPGAPGAENGGGPEAETGGDQAAGAEPGGPDLEAPARAEKQMKSEALFKKIHHLIKKN